MATRYDAIIGDTVTLEVIFKLGEDLFDPFEITKVELLDDDLVVVETKETVDITQISTGHYSVEFGPMLEAGTFCDHWFFIAAEGGETSVLVFAVEVVGVSGEEGDSGEDEDVTDPPPTIGLDNTVEITHTFYDAGGNAFKGVYVRFRPTIVPLEVAGFIGSVARDIDGVSDENGVLKALDGSAYRLVRGVTGTLAITGVGLVREVTTPDVGTIDLLDLMSTGDDRFTVQNIDFVDLPRRS